MNEENNKSVGYINIPYLNTGSVADLQIEQNNNSSLDKQLDKIESLIREDKEKYDMDKFFNELS